MSVISVEQTWTGRTGTAAGVGSSITRRTYLAKTDNKLDDEHTVLRSGLVPVAYQSILDSNPFFLCRAVTATQKSESPYAWDVEAEYSDEPLGKEEKDEQENENPLARPPKINWDSEQYQKAVWKDKDGNPIFNSANDPFDPPPEIDDARWVVNVQQNVAVVPTFVLDMNNVINNAAITIDGVPFPAKTAKVQNIKVGDEQTENGVLFRSFSYQVHYRKDTWVLAPLDAGYQFLETTDPDGEGGNPPVTTKKEIALADGEKPSSPQPLDGAGGVLSDPSPETAVFLNFDVYNEADLTVLPGVT